jgi:hypothetical protein
MTAAMSKRPSELPPSVAQKKPRLSEYIPPNISNSTLDLERCLITQDEHQYRSRPPTPAKQLSTAHLQQAMIEVCHNPRASHIKTIMKELEHHLELPDNALAERKGDIENWFQILSELHINTHVVQSLNQLPL